MTIVDSHVHFWDPGRLKYAWLKDVPSLNRAFLPSGFQEAAAGVNVGKLIFVECSCAEYQSLEEVSWAGAFAKEYPVISGIVAHAPLEMGIEVRDYLRRLQQFSLVKGVRRLIQGERYPDFCLKPEFITGSRMVGEYGFTCDLCIRADQLPYAAELAHRVPETKFILDHFGKPGVKDKQFQPWADHLRRMASAPNAYCKFSGLATEADWLLWEAGDLKPYFEHAMEVFGPDRILFGGDWPVATLATRYSDWFDTVYDLTCSLGSEGLEKLFQTNAEKVYRI